MNKKIMLGLAILLLVAGTFASQSAFAQTTNDTSPMSSLVEKIATKFNLNKDDVQEIFDEDRQAHETEMKMNYEKKLSDAVASGKITEAQKTLILQKHTEMEASRKANMQNMKNLSQDARKAQFEKEKTALDAWAKENGIDTQYLFGLGGRGHRGHGPGRPAPVTQ